MNFIVYSYGGADILWKVLNGMAMIGNSDIMHRLGVLMMGIGILTVAMRAIPAASFPLLFRRWILPMFVLLGFFWGPKVTVNLVDNVNPQFRAASVANVPFGIALGASLSTGFSKTLTEIIERVLVSSDMERSSQTGPLFAARLMYEARTLTIKDPIMRENIKDFTRQCFAWPFIFTNIRPGKKAAMESQDMLAFIEENAHKALGMYWRQPDGQSKFMFCAQCAAQVRQVLPLEIQSGWRSLAGKLFGSTEDGVAETARLQQYFGDAWQYLAKGSSDVAQAIQQELMLNAYRAALQDKREEFGLSRNPALSYLNAERGQLQQDESFLIKAALSGTQIPNLHGFLMGFALVVFAIMAPFTLMEGGYQMVFTFGKIMLWLATWPPLFAILNCMGYMYLGKSASAQLMGYGEGLNLMTQNGLADMAYHTYAFIMGLQYSVPFVSWAMLSSGGGYALAQFSSFLTQSGESFAGKAAAEVVDGNVTFDSQTLHHRSVANTQLAQQQIGPSINSGARFDDGSLSVLYGQAQDGQSDRMATFNQHLSQMGTNLARNDALSAMMGWRSEDAYNSGVTNSKMAGRQVQAGMNETVGMLQHLNTSEGFAKTFGDNVATNVQKSLSESMDLVKQVAKDRNVSVDKAFEMVGGLAANLGLSFGSGKGLGGSILGNINANYKSSARDAEALSEHVKSGKIQQFADNMGAVFQHLEDNKGSISDTFVKQKMDQAQWHFNEAQHYSDQASSNYSQSKTYAQMASAQRQKGISSSSNLTDSAIGSLANQQYGGDRLTAAQKAVQNPEMLASVASSQIDRSEAQAASTQSPDSIRQHYQATSTKIVVPERPSQMDLTREDIAHQAQELTDTVQDVQEKATQQMKQQKSKLSGGKKVVDQEYGKIKSELDESSAKSLPKKAWDKMWKE